MLEKKIRRLMPMRTEGSRSREIEAQAEGDGMLGTSFDSFR